MNVGSGIGKDESWQDYLKRRDTDYRGKQREDGMYWNGEFEYYEEPEDIQSYRIEQNEDGTWNCWFVYIGSWNVEITAGEELVMQEQFPEKQDYYKWLYENKQRTV